MINVYKKYEVHKLYKREIDDVIYKTIKNCRDFYFHSIECSYICDNEFTNIKIRKILNKEFEVFMVIEYINLLVKL